MVEMFERDEVTCEIIAPSEIAPLDTTVIGESVARTFSTTAMAAGSRGWRLSLVKQ